MNTWDEPEYGEPDAIADAVRTYPLAPVPPGLPAAIMAQVHSVSPRPRFELSWVDVALALFGVSMTGVAWLLWQWLPNWSDWADYVVPNLAIPLDPTYIAIGAVGAAGGLMVMGLCLLTALVILAPRPAVRLEAVSR